MRATESFNMWVNINVYWLNKTLIFCRVQNICRTNKYDGNNTKERMESMELKCLKVKAFSSNRQKYYFVYICDNSRTQLLISKITTKK